MERGVDGNAPCDVRLRMIHCTILSVARVVKRATLVLVFEFVRGFRFEETSVSILFREAFPSISPSFLGYKYSRNNILSR